MKHVERINILGVEIADISRNEVLHFIDLAISNNKKIQICTVNNEFIIEAQKNEAFKRVLNTSLAIADSSGVVWASSVLHKIKIEKIPGADLVEDIMSQAALKGHRVFLFGGRSGIAHRAKEALMKKYKNIHIVGTIDGDRVENPRETPELIARINETKPDILLVALGAPKQDLWINYNLDLLNANVFVGVGGTLDYISGEIKRAPKAFRKFSLEWLFRLFVEPKRYKRIFRATVVFPWMVFTQKIGEM